MQKGKVNHHYEVDDKLPDDILKVLALRGLACATSAATITYGLVVRQTPVDG